MRRLLLALAAVLLGAAPAAAGSGDHQGWVAVDCGCTDAQSIDAVTRDLVFLGTGTGIRRSTDGGITWHVLGTPVHREVRRVSFADADTGLAQGDFTGVLVTSDGGATWQQRSPWPGRTTDVTALPGALFALATSGLYSSTDGTSWRRLPAAFPPYAGSARMDWSSPTEGVVTGGPDVLVTADGGRTFTRARAPGSVLTDALSLGAGSGFAVGQDGTHRARPWALHVTGPTAAPADLPDRGVADERELGISQSGSTVYVVGAHGLVARSTDEGTTWAYEDLPAGYQGSTLADVDSVDADHAWIAVRSGRVLLRDVPTVRDTTSSPHRGVGLGLLGLATLGVVGAAAAAGTGRRPVAGGLAAMTLVSGVGGYLAVTADRTCPATGCTALAAPAEAGPTPRRTPTPTPSALPSPASPTPTATPTPSPAASSAGPSAATTPTPTPPRPTATARRTPSPTPTPTPTPRQTPAGAFTAALTREPQCDEQGRAGAGMITLRNTTGSAVAWTASVREGSSASLSPRSGSVASGRSSEVRVTPDDALCTPGDEPTTLHVDVRHGGTTTTVTMTVTPQT